jgi:hypothetical protein
VCCQGWMANGLIVSLCCLAACAAGAAGYKRSKEEKVQLLDFLGRSVLPSSRGTYKRGWALWLEYLAGLNSQRNPGSRMERVNGVHCRAERLVLFYRFLYASKGIRSERIGGISSALRYAMDCRGVDTSFFMTAVASRGRKAGRRSVEEMSSYQAWREEKRILPVGLEVVLDLRRALWTSSGWDTRKGVDCKGIWIAIGLGFDSGSRIGSVTLKDGPTASDHCIRAKHVSFELVHDQTGESICRAGGESFRQWYQKGGYTVKYVTCLYHTSKTAHKRTSLDAEDEGDNLLIRDLVEWVMRSGVRAEDELTTRYFQGARKVTIRKDTVTAIKEACGRLGLDPSRFSTKSLRSGFATQYAVSGGEARDRCLQGGWTQGSATPAAHYDNHVPKGALSLGLSSKRSLSLGDMRRLASGDSGGWAAGQC